MGLKSWTNLLRMIDNRMDQEEIVDSASNTATQVVDMVPVSSISDVAEILMPPPPAPQNLPPGCPAWAARLKDCEVSNSSKL